MNKEVPSILISDRVSREGIERLQREAHVDLLTELSDQELLRMIERYDAIIVRSKTKVTRDVIERGERLKVIGRAGVGIDNIDLDFATKRGVLVVNSPEGNTISAAEHTISMLLSLARNIPSANRSVKMGEWRKSDFMGTEVRDKTLGILGMGRIGSQVAKRANALEMNVIAFDPFISESKMESIGVKRVDLETLLKESDFITVHVPLTKKTENIIGEKEFKKMKDGVRVINCARGGIINEEALYRAIKEGKVAGASLDVFIDEPPKDNPLLKLDEVIATPHIAASTREAQKNVSVSIAEEVLAALKNGAIKNALNMPTIPSDVLNAIKPYISLAEKLGRLTAQLIDGMVLNVKMRYNGEIADYETKYVTTAALMGMLNNILEEPINFINAPVVAKDREIKTVEIKSKYIEDFTSQITLEVEADKVKRVIGGTIFGKNDERIVRIDEYRIDAIPSGYMLISRHTDKPGIIGKVGQLLGEEDIDIAGMQLGRKKQRGQAIMVLNVDSPIPEQILEEIRKIDGIEDAHLVMV
jgi:D-3-phosphoglycerate dehydrogenase